LICVATLFAPQSRHREAA